MNSRLLWSLGGGLIFTAAIGALVMWVLLAADTAARDGSTQFAAALVSGEAPQGTHRFVRGVRSHYGDVTSARVIDTRNHRVGRGDNARTYHLSDVLLQTAKGPAVIELEFDGFGPVSKDITDVYELAPRDVPGGALSEDEFVALAKAYDRRGGYAVADLGLVRAEVPDAVEAPPAKLRRLRETSTPAPGPRAVRAAVTPSPQMREGQRRLECVQKAEGDVEKLAACA
jgi:hypothetical protein